MISTSKQREEIFLRHKKKTYFDPRTKFVILVAFLVCVLSSMNLYVLVAIVTLSFISLILTRIKFKFILLSIFFLTLFSFVGTVIAYFTVEVENIYYLFGIIEIRFLTSFFIVSWFFNSVSPYELSISLEKMYVPATITWLLTTIYQFIPVLGKEAQEINDIRKLKGLSAKKWQIKKQSYILTKTLRPLITGSINRSVDLAEAMIIKGFKPMRRKNHILDLHIKITDIILMLITIAAMVCIIIFFRQESLFFLQEV
ncbi:MAG: energy-coupling factor transporter transmembrane component T [Candidatus Heimdallarchaeota archaeon]